ncbi:MAG TPA: VOC family protein [Bacillota bacterium]|nr:VOC family protein [Bacillota bacterium]
MHIEHIALWTNDLERLKQFYLDYFQGKAGIKYCNPLKGFESYFIAFDSGARLEIMTLLKGLGENAATEERLIVGYSHLAFAVSSRAKVDQLTEELQQNGYPVVSEPRTTGDGYYESCVLDPDGNRVEITC